MSARRAIVTGTNSGIGKATVLLLAERGYDLGLTYAENRDGADATATVARAFGHRVFVERMQLEDPELIASAIA